MNNINVDDGLGFAVDQFKEIALKVGDKRCTKTTQIMELQEEKDAFGKAIGGSKESIVEPSTKTRVGVAKKKHGRESTETHNS